MKNLSFISAQITIRQLLEGRVKFKDTPTLKSVFLNNEPEARFFGPDWKTVTEAVIESLKHPTSPNV